MSDQTDADDLVAANAAVPYAYIALDVSDADGPPSGREGADRASVVLDVDLDRVRVEVDRLNARHGTRFGVYGLVPVDDARLSDSA